MFKKELQNKLSEIKKQLENPNYNPEKIKTKISNFVSKYISESGEDLLKDIQGVEFKIKGVAASIEAQNDRRNKAKQEIIAILNRIEVLVKNNEIKRLPRPNTLSSLSNLQLYPILFLIASSFYGIGYKYKSYQYDKDKLELYEKTKMLSDSIEVLSKKIETFDLTILQKNDSIKILLLKLKNQAQLPTKNILHLTDSAINEDDSN